MGNLELGRENPRIERNISTIESNTPIQLKMSVPSIFDFQSIITDGIPTATSPEPQGAALVPREFLDAILEVATLYGMTFGGTISN